MLSMHQASQRERAAVAALQRVPRELKGGLKDLGRDTFTPMLVNEARHRAHGTLAGRIVGTGRHAEFRGTPGVKFGGSRRVTASGVTARELARAVEFGSDGRRWRDYLTHSPKGTQYSVLRRTTRQFMPDTGAEGRAITPAAVAITDRVMDEWTQLVETIIVDAFSEGG